MSSQGRELWLYPLASCASHNVSSRIDETGGSSCSEGAGQISVQQEPSSRWCFFTSHYNELMRFGDLEERQVHPSHSEEESG